MDVRRKVARLSGETPPPAIRDTAMPPLRSALIFSILLLPIAQAQASRPLSPAETFDLYAALITRNDADARTALKASFGEAGRQDEEVELLAALSLFSNEMPSIMGAMASAAGMGDAATAVAPAIQARLDKLRCVATGQTAPAGDALKTAAVDFQCNYPDLSSLKDRFRSARQEGGQPGPQLRAFVAAYTTAMANAPDLTHRGTATFVRDGRDRMWVGTNLEQLHGFFLEAFMPFTRWDTAMAAESVPAITGIASCDLLLDGHRTQTLRTAPGDIAATVALESDYQQRAEHGDRDLLAVHCSALHAQWKEAWEKQE